MRASRIAGVAVGGFVILGFLVVAGGAARAKPIVVKAPVLATGSFNLSNAGDSTTLYSTDPAKQMALSIDNDGAGSVEVSAHIPDTMNAVVLGTVAAGSICIFEGTYLDFIVTAVGQGCSGPWVVRGPTDETSSTHLVGEGQMTVTAGDWVRVYKGDPGFSRIFEITSSSSSTGGIEFALSYQGEIVMAAPVDEPIGGNVVASEFWAHCPSGQAIITLKIFDLFIGTGAGDVPYTLTGNETRRIWRSKDAPACLTHDIVNVSNTRTLKLTVKWKNESTPEDSEVPPTEPSPGINCHIEYIDATFVGASASEINVLKRNSHID